MDVLIVDDEPLTRDIVADDLAQEGLEVAEASTAEDALALANSAGPPAVVVTDVDLGAGMDGLVLAQEVRRRWPRCAVVVVASDSDRLDGHAFRQRETFLTKPFGPARLVAAVREFMGRSAR